MNKKHIDLTNDKRVKYLLDSGTKKEAREGIEQLLNTEETETSTQILQSLWNTTETIDSNVCFNKNQKTLNSLHQSIEKGNTTIRVLRISQRIAAILILPLLCFSAWQFMSIQGLKSRMEKTTEICSDIGGRIVHELPDGSKIWLNNDSKVLYSQSFASDNRNIALEGEAYFDVKHDKKNPFVVTMGEVKVEVLGTKFNATNYSDFEHIDVTLVQGKVNITSITNDEKTILAELKPGQLSRFNKNTKKISVKATNVKRNTAWRKGYLIFDNTPLNEFISRVQRRYNCTIKINSENLNSYLVTGAVKSDNLNLFLNDIAKILPIKYQIENSSNSYLYEPRVVTFTYNE